MEKKEPEEQERPDEVTATYPEQKFSPVQYNSFGVGPFYYKTHVRPGETPEAAMARAFAVCQKMAREAYGHVRDDYFERVQDAVKKARARDR